MSEKVSIPKSSVDTTRIYDALQALAVGEEVSYSDLSTLIGRDVRAEARHNLESAKRQHLREGRAFGTVVGVGIRRLVDSEIVGEGQRGIKHIWRTAKRTAQKLAAFSNFAGMSRPEQRQAIAMQSTLGALRAFSAQKAVRAIEAGIADDAVKAIDTGRVIELLSGKQDESN